MEPEFFYEMRSDLSKAMLNEIEDKGRLRLFKKIKWVNGN